MARAYASIFPETAGFRLGTGWYAVALGPFDPAEAAGKLADLRSQGLIPSDSYITDGAAHGAQFWPATGTTSEWPDNTTAPSMRGPAWAIRAAFCRHFVLKKMNRS